jgi:hypothetical protein
MPGELPQQPAQFGEVAVRLLAQPPQVPTPSVGQQLGGVAELGGRALVVAPVSAPTQRVHPFLPVGVGHPARIAQPRVVQGPGGVDGDRAPDPGAEQMRQHQQPVQRLWGVLQRDARLLGERLPVRAHEFPYDPLVVAHGFSGSWPIVIN